MSVQHNKIKSTASKVNWINSSFCYFEQMLNITTLIKLRFTASVTLERIHFHYGVPNELATECRSVYTHVHTHTYAPTPSVGHVPDSWWGHQISLTNTLTLKVRHSESQYTERASLFLRLPICLSPLSAPNITLDPCWASSQNHSIHSSSHTHTHIHTV